MKLLSRYGTIPCDSENPLEQYLQFLPEMTIPAHIYRHRAQIPEDSDVYVWDKNGIKNFYSTKEIVKNFFKNPHYWAQRYLEVHGDDQRAYDGIRNFYPHLPHKGGVADFFSIIGDKPYNPITPLSPTAEDVVCEAKNSTTLFLDAVKKEKYTLLEHYIDDLGVKFNFDQTLYGNGNPLYWATRKKSPKLFQFLVDKSATPGNLTSFGHKMTRAFINGDQDWLEALAHSEASPQELVHYILGIREMPDLDGEFTGSCEIAPEYDVRNVLKMLHPSDRWMVWLHTVCLDFEVDRAAKEIAQIITIQPAYLERIIAIISELKLEKSHCQNSFLAQIVLAEQEFPDANERLDELVERIRNFTL